MARDATQKTLEQLAALYLTGVKDNGDNTPQEVQDMSQVKDQPPGSLHAHEQDVDPLKGPPPIRLQPKLPGHAARSAPSVTQASHGTGVEPEQPAVDTQDHHEPVIVQQHPRLRLHRAEPDEDGRSSSMGADGRSDHVVADDVDVMQKDEESSVMTDESDSSRTTDHASFSEFELPQQRRKAWVEAVIKGNLPGLSGPWLTQYAQLLAQELGPVALLHVEASQLELELIEPTNRSLRDGRRVYRQPPLKGGTLDATAMLDALVSHEQMPVRMILVHLDPQADADSLQRLLDFDYWTLLCGTDDAAVVGAYRQLKQLVEARADAGGKQVGLMLMGSDQSTSQAAAGKLRMASTSFLHTPLEMVGYLQKMMPVNVRQIASFEPTEAHWPRLKAWFDALEDPAFEQPAEEDELASLTQFTPPLARQDGQEIGDKSQEARESEPVKSEASPKAAQPAALEGKDAPRLLDELFRQRAGGQPASSTSATEQPTRDTRGEASPPTPTKQPQPPREKPKVPRQVATDAAATDEHRQHEKDEAPSLASLLITQTGAIPGGVVLEARCPHQPQCQLVLDQAGKLHLLRRHDSGSADQALPASRVDAGEASLRRAIVDLLEARTWVMAHLDLLQLTQRQCRFDDASPTLHLFTDRADLAVRLIARLEQETIRLHLLQHISVGRETTWFCTPLG